VKSLPTKSTVIPLRRYSEEQVREVLTGILPHWLPKNGEAADTEQTTGYLVNEVVRRLREHGEPDTLRERLTVGCEGCGATVPLYAGYCRECWGVRS
jgi:hypothetical protein